MLCELSCWASHVSFVFQVAGGPTIAPTEATAATAVPTEPVGAAEPAPLPSHAGGPTAPKAG